VVYLNSFTFPNAEMEFDFILKIKRTHVSETKSGYVINPPFNCKCGQYCCDIKGKPSSDYIPPDDNSNYLSNDNNKSNEVKIKNVSINDSLVGNIILVLILKSLAVVTLDVHFNVIELLSESYVPLKFFTLWAYNSTSADAAPINN